MRWPENSSVPKTFGLICQRGILFGISAPDLLEKTFLNEVPTLISFSKELMLYSGNGSCFSCAMTATQSDLIICSRFSGYKLALLDSAQCRVSGMNLELFPTNSV